MKKKIKKILIGNNKEYKGKALISFIDILGFSKNIENNWNILDSNKNPLDLILKIKNQLPGKSVTDELYVKNTKGDKLHISIHSRIDSISDSFILSHPIKNENFFTYFAGLYNISKNIYEIWKTLIKNSFTIRGAISFGDIYWNNKDVIGPSFIDAYKNEKELAKVSRVILTSKCNEILHLILKSEFRELIIEFFFKDIDGFTALNPKKLYENNQEKNELIKKLNEMKDDQKRFYEKEKYIPLLNLLNNEEKSVDILHY